MPQSCQRGKAAKQVVAAKHAGDPMNAVFRKQPSKRRESKLGWISPEMLPRQHPDAGRLFQCEQGATRLGKPLRVANLEKDSEMAAHCHDTAITIA